MITYWTGLVDGTDKCFLGGTPYGLMEQPVFVLRRSMLFMTGKRTMEFQNRAIIWESAAPTLARTFCELVKVSDAEVLMRYGDDFYAGAPVVTHKAYGKGHVYYVGADMEQAFYSDFYGKAAKETGIQAPLGFVPAEVSVTLRENQENEYLFIQNYARETKAVPVPAEYEVIYGAADEIMQPLATRVLKKKK